MCNEVHLWALSWRGGRAWWGSESLYTVTNTCPLLSVFTTSVCSSFQLERAGVCGPGGGLVKVPPLLSKLTPWALVCLKSLNCQLHHAKSRVELIQLGRKYEPQLNRHFPPHFAPRGINIFLFHSPLKLLKKVQQYFHAQGKILLQRWANWALENSNKGSWKWQKIVSCRCKVID